MADGVITEAFMAREVARGFVLAWGHRKPLRLTDDDPATCTRTLAVEVNVATTEALDTMVPRLHRVGRILADAAMRYRARRVAAPKPPATGGTLVKHYGRGFALRFTPRWNATLGAHTYIADMWVSR